MPLDASATDVVVRIVDDDAAICRALARLVESLGMCAETYASAEQLLTQGLDDRASCLLLDVQLPGLDGFELYRRIVEGGQEAPVIFITANPHENARSRARRARAVALLEKPLDEGVLLTALEEALARSPNTFGRLPDPE